MRRSSSALASSPAPARSSSTTGSTVTRCVPSSIRTRSASSAGLPVPWRNSTHTGVSTRTIGGLITRRRGEPRSASSRRRRPTPSHASRAPRPGPSADPPRGAARSAPPRPGSWSGAAPSPSGAARRPPSSTSVPAPSSPSPAATPRRPPHPGPAVRAAPCVPHAVRGVPRRTPSASRPPPPTGLPPARPRPSQPAIAYSWHEYIVLTPYAPAGCAHVVVRRTRPRVPGSGKIAKKSSWSLEGGSLSSGSLCADAIGAVVRYAHALQRSPLQGVARSAGLQGVPTTAVRSARYTCSYEWLRASHAYLGPDRRALRRPAGRKVVPNRRSATVPRLAAVERDRDGRHCGTVQPVRRACCRHVGSLGLYRDGNDRGRAPRSRRPDGPLGFAGAPKRTGRVHPCAAKVEASRCGRPAGGHRCRKRCPRRWTHRYRAQWGGHIQAADLESDHEQAAGVVPVRAHGRGSRDQREA